MATRNPFCLALLAAAAFGGIACSGVEHGASKKAPTESAPRLAAVDPVKRGEQLVSMGGCGDCHTPMKFDPALGMPVPQRERLLSGHPEGAPDPEGAPGKGDQAVIGPTFTSFRLPFGVVYTANLTPDPETGIGSWTAEQFIRAVRGGKHRGEANGRPILPPMPWMNLALQSDDDLRAVFAYLKSLPPVKNAVPSPKVPGEALAAIDRSYAKLRMN
jgi:hypothetical protein